MDRQDAAPTSNWTQKTDRQETADRPTTAASGWLRTFPATRPETAPRTTTAAGAASKDWKGQSPRAEARNRDRRAIRSAPGFSGVTGATEKEENRVCQAGQESIFYSRFSFATQTEPNKISGCSGSELSSLRPRATIAAIGEQGKIQIACRFSLSPAVSSQ